jgi:hypothetical protein
LIVGGALALFGNLERPPAMERSPHAVPTVRGTATASSVVISADFVESESRRNASSPEDERASLVAVVHGSDGELRGAVLEARAAADPEDRRAAFARAPNEHVWDDLPLGTWVITCSAPGHQRQQRAVLLTSDVSESRTSFVLEPSSNLEVRLRTLGNEPFWLVAHQPELRALRPYLWVVATSEPPSGSYPWTPGSRHRRAGLGVLSGSSGELEADELGTLTVDADAPIHVSLLLKGDVLQTQLVDQGQGEITFWYSPDDLLLMLGSVRMRVVSSADGAPLAGARFRTSEGLSAVKRGGDEGSFLLADLLPGAVDVHVTAPGYAERSVPATVEPGGVIDLGTIHLQRATEIVLRWTGSESTAVRYRISLGDRIVDSGTMSPVRTARLSLPSASYRLEVLDRHGSHLVDRALVVEGAPFELELRPAG